MFEMKLYKHSENISFLGFFIALGLGTILAILVSFIYNLLIVVIPIVYINFFITLGFGLLLAYGVNFFSRLGKVRNKKQEIIIASIVGFIGFYFQWIAYFVFLINGEHSFIAYKDSINLFYNIKLFIDLITELNQSGYWEIFGVLLKGFPLWIIWGIEAGLIIGIPIIAAINHPIIPFSETYNKWYPKYILNNEFEKISTINEFKENLLKNTEQAINDLKHGDPFRFSKISIYYIDNEQKQYLSVENVLVEKRGKGKSKFTPIIHLFEISTDTANNLMDKYEAKKQYFFNY